MNALILLSSAVAFGAFGATAVLLLKMWGRSRHAWPEPAPIILATAMALGALVGLSNVLEYAGVYSAMDVLEDSAELLFIPLIFFTVYASEVQAASVQRQQAARLIERQNDMLMGIVDMSPSGIMVVASGGHILFTNDAAERILELGRSDACDDFEAPAWTLRGASGAVTSLSDLIVGARLSDEPHTLEWPDGRVAHVRLTLTPMSDATEQLGGALVAIERVAAPTAASA